MWVKKVRPRRRRGRTKEPTKLYQTHKERARELVHARLALWNTESFFTYNRVAIRDQKSRWGSCSQRGNLNFNYRIVFLPEHLIDYVIVHELCHLKEFNHAASFWKLVEEKIPAYKIHRAELKRMTVRRGVAVEI